MMGCTGGYRFWGVGSELEVVCVIRSWFEGKRYMFT